MGARQSKLRHLYRRTLKRRKSRKIGRKSADAGDEEMLLLGPMEVEEPSCTQLPACGCGGCSATCATWAEQLEAMHREMDSLGTALRNQLGQLDTDHRRRLEHCAKQWLHRVEHNHNLLPDRKLQAQTEECRLRSAILAEKLRNCVDYLQSYEAQIHSILHREQQQRQQQEQLHEDDDFLREFLLKAARRHHRKGQLGQALNTFCQLLLATDGRIREEEMDLLEEVCREKIRHTRDFHERVSLAVSEQLDTTATLRGNLAIQEMWSQVVEELRADCADAYDIVMRVQNDAEEEEFDTQKQNLEQRKLLMASSICALWLHITPQEHEEFDGLKALFFRTLNPYIDTFRSNPSSDQQQLEQALRELIGDYPTVADTKKMRRIARVVFHKKIINSENT